LNRIENKILKTVNENTFSSRKKMIQKLLKNEKIYGFGDVQYNNKVNNLKKLFHSFNPVKLNNKGKEVLKNKINFYSQIRNDISFLGGAKKYSYLFNNESEKLLQITT
jgi:nicotinamide mononucleotide adenylyltransferase